VDFDDFPDGVLIAGPDGKVEYVNDRVRDMARAGDDEMIGMPLEEALPFDDLNGNTWFACTQPYDGLATRTRISEQAWWSPRGSEYLITARLVRDRPGGKVQRVVVNNVNDTAYFAKIVLATDSHEVAVDAAPSDAIALALRAKAPIYADAAVLDKAGIVSGR
jgi:PAS domain-containing protein